MGKYNEAGNVFKILTSKKKENGQAWLMVGYSALMENDFSKAQNAFTHAAK